MRLAMKQNQQKSYEFERRDFGKPIGLIASFFGCWHKDLTRPFTHGKNSYIACLDCGARKHFDIKRWVEFGSFYFPPDVRKGN